MESHQRYTSCWQRLHVACHTTDDTFHLTAPTRQAQSFQSTHLVDSSQSHYEVFLCMLKSAEAMAMAKEAKKKKKKKTSMRELWCVLY